MPLRVGIISAKGGSGKSTLAVNLARAIQLDGKEVAVVDTDPQRSATEWGTRQPEGYGLPVRHVNDAEGDSLYERLCAASEGADVAVIDGSAKLDGATGAIVRASHAVLIPVQPTPMDSWGIRSVVKVVKDTGTRAGLVVSRQIVGTNLAGEVADGIEGYDLPIFDARTSQRVAYAESMFEGKTVLDVPGAKKAAREIQGIATELAQLLEAE
nr:ParA family partition ATPase [Salinibacter ruber]